jgi:hypothetical protein
MNRTLQLFNLVVLVTLPISATASATPQIIISEFLASNKDSILDEDGDSSDWLELHNLGNEEVNLKGWYLSDKSDNLTKWSLPDISIGPGAYLFIFASGKDRRNPASELHTNFKLGADGEYLGLIQPDGLTVEYAFAPDFPVQTTNVSYGLVRETMRLAMIAKDARLNFHLPLDSTVDGAWRSIEFNDESWTEGINGLGYDRDGRYATFTRTDVQDVMKRAGTSIYARITFDLEDPESLSAATLSVRYDDGFQAYLNGTPTASANSPELLSWSSAATSSGAMTDPVPYNVDPALLLSGEECTRTSWTE